MRLLVCLWPAFRAAGTFWKIQSPLTLIHLLSVLDSLQFLKTLKDTSLWFSFLWVDEDAGRQIFQLAQLMRGDCVGVAKVCFLCFQFGLASCPSWLTWLLSFSCRPALIPVMTIQRSVWNRSCGAAWAVKRGLLLRDSRFRNVLSYYI